jgi:cysteine synthase A
MATHVKSVWASAPLTVRQKFAALIRFVLFGLTVLAVGLAGLPSPLWLRDHHHVESILGAIGNTPLIRLRRCAPPNGAELWLKLEYRNPSGSMKDRMALAMIEGAERDGLISPGDTVVEYTGGSTGPALALVCRAKGYRALIVIADCFTEERFQLIRALGAAIDVVPSVEGPPKVTPQDIENMVARAAELASEPGHYATDQFNNPYVVPDHRDRLGREIWKQSEGRVTAFCHGLGTAGSLMGVSDALKPHGVFIQAHEPAGSAAISDGAAGPFLIQGWSGVVMPHWDSDKVDHVAPIDDDEALAMTRRLAREEGIFAGISTGANVVGAHQLAERLGPDAVIVTLAVDTGFKYMSVSPYADA